MKETKGPGSLVSQDIEVPLVVDLDGTLIKSDLIYESFFGAFQSGLSPVVHSLVSLSTGKAALKKNLAANSDIDYATLPYRQSVLDLIASAKEQGRQIVLATASDAKHAQGVADHLGVFDRVFSSDGITNLSSSKKASALVSAYGEQGFDYVGNDTADIPVWQSSRTAYSVGATASIHRRLQAAGREHVTIDCEPTRPKAWMKAIRVHQYAKNMLVFVPLVTAQKFTPEAILNSALAFIAFCMCASSVYIINDLLDLKSDRGHLSKRRRPLASGSISIQNAVIAVPVLIVAASILAIVGGWPFCVALAAYFALTCAYSFYLKRRMLVDVVTLALLYTLRIFGGASAIGVEVSHWLLGFSLFLFTSLALMKRYVELAGRVDRSLPDPTDRNYRLSDLSIVAALAAATGVNAVLVLSLYVASPEIQTNYHRPEALWLMCPVLLYWIGRALMMAHRRDMNDDPIVFALTDRNSRIAVVCVMAIVSFALWG